MRKILVTGAAGYIGSVLCDALAGDNVVRFDSLRFGQDPHRVLGILQGDIRRPEDRVAGLKGGVEAVVNLAALVGEAACNVNTHDTWTVNCKSAVALAKEARALGVRRFIQVSTCSNYGVADAATEESELKPLSAYAASKVQAERDILALNGANFRVTALRLATVYGCSPRMRFDLLVNEWVRDALMKGRISVYGSEMRRPYVHVEDVAQALRLCLLSDVGGEIFNIGSTSENIAKGELANMVCNAIAGTKIDFHGEGTDRRDYRVIFDKARDILGFQPEWTVARGIEQIASAISNGDYSDPYDPRYRNA